jgi:hypothetical protein
MTLKRVSPNYIILEEDDKTIKVAVPFNYDPSALEELRFFADKEVLIEKSLPL